MLRQYLDAVAEIKRIQELCLYLIVEWCQFLASNLKNPKTLKTQDKLKTGKILCATEIGIFLVSFW